MLCHPFSKIPEKRIAALTRDSLQQQRTGVRFVNLENVNLFSKTEKAESRLADLIASVRPLMGATPLSIKEDSLRVLLIEASV
jgi:hypothetical protein